MRNRPWLVTLLILTLVATTGFAAKEPRNEPVGAMSSTPNSVDWNVTAAHAKVVLTVTAPDGETSSFEFSGRPSLKMQDLGKNPQEGTYIYELRLEPVVSASVAAKLKAARAAGDDKAAAKAQKEAGLDKTLSQSGAFSVSKGAFVSVDSEEGSVNGNAVGRQTTSGASSEAGAGSVSAGGNSKPWRQVVQDQVIPDDLIVQGSACVGLDCVNNESFGFDTIRLKENNTRIKFDDTSSSAGFPANDWQLTANDSASGGSSKFSIEDITGSKVPFTVTAGASTNSIFVDSTGRVGFRTSTPVLDLHVNTSNTPALRLEQNSSGGFTAQTWDVAGNEANFFVRDVTGGSRLPFRIRPGAPTSSVDISASGNVGIGTASPSTSLHVSGSAGSTKLLVEETNATTTAREIAELRNNGNAVLILEDTSVAERWTFTGGTNFLINNQNNAGIEYTFGNTGNFTAAGTITPGSSRAIKSNFSTVNATEMLNKVLELPITTWNYKRDPQTVRHIGPMAEDFYKSFAVGADDKGISVTDSAGVAFAAIQGLHQELTSKQAEIDRLAKANAELEARLARLEALVTQKQ